MKRFRKMVAIEPTRLFPDWDARLRSYAEESVFFEDIPTDSGEILRRIGDADCVLLSHTTRIDREIIEACPSIRYIGMCCSLYAPESANVDILFAKEKGITVTGVRDYGDNGVAEYAVSELVRLMQGRGEFQWREEALEFTGLAVGIVGMGTLGGVVARALSFFGARIFYYSRTRKPELEGEYAYLPLEELLPKAEILITCLNKNVVLFGEREFSLFGDGKLFMNVSIAPSFEIPAMRRWLGGKGNYALSDSVAGLGEEIAALPSAIHGTRSAGMTSLAKVRLGEKVLANMEGFLA